MPKTLTSNDSSTEETDSGPHRELSRMIDAGRSFSGNERNCFFLNTQDGQFATMSAGSGLDFADDGRAIAINDWDHDGDLDLWVSNRNAPRLRFMKNNAVTENHFLALELIGNGISSNRDAIGARVEVVTGGSRTGKRLVATLRAGEGFLSQSGKALHFGLGHATVVEKVLVRWPDGREDVFSDLLVDRRHRIRQGETKAVLVPRRNSVDLEKPAPTSESTTLPSGIRVPAVTLLRLPQINLSKKDGTKVNAEGRHQLIHLWASWCPDCLSEMKEFSEQAGRLRDAGVEILALNVDNLGDQEISSSAVSDVLAKLKFPFPSTKATAPLLESLQRFHDSLVGLNRPMPVPTSFLVDPDGRFSVFYKGPVEVNQIIADLGHSEGQLEERMQNAAAIDGSLIPHPLVRRKSREHEAWIQERFAKALEQAGDIGAAIYHYSTALQLDPTSADVAQKLGELHFSKQEWQEAILAIEKALALNPDDAKSHYRLAQLLARVGRPDEARIHFEIALAQNPGNALVHFGFAAFLESSQEVKGAVSLYRKGLSLQPGNNLAKNNLAWILSTSYDEEVRDPKAGLALARELNKATGDKLVNILDTLGAAEAAAGNYEEAVAISLRTIRKAQADGGQQMLKDLNKRLKIYQSKQPYIQRKP